VTDASCLLLPLLPPVRDNGLRSCIAAAATISEARSLEITAGKNEFFYQKNKFEVFKFF